MRDYSVEELDKLPDLPLLHLSIYIEIPADYLCKVGKDYEPHLLYNPKTGHVIVYSYWESSCYGDSASDIQFNGHYSELISYKAKEK